MMRKLESLIRKRVSDYRLFKIMCFFPVKRNRIFFQSFRTPGFTDNPQYLCRALYEMCNDRLEYICAFDNNDQSAEVPYVKMAQYRSLLWLYYLATSKTVVWNNFTPLWLTRRKGQLIINTWHAGGAFKRTGLYRISADESKAEQQINQYINLFSSSSQIFTEFNIIEGWHYHGEILKCGMPRNDIFFSQEDVRKSSDKIRKHFGLGDSLCVLFAPTYRGNGEKTIDMIPPLGEVREVLQKKTGRTVSILLRRHRRDKNHYVVSEAIYDVSSYPDAQELLCCADILITDYSSIIWDYALLARPCFLFVPDKNEYETNRGLFTPIEDWPGIICRDRNELLQEIIEMDEKRSQEIAKRYLEKAGSYENGNAAKVLAKRIGQHMAVQM